MNDVSVPIAPPSTLTAIDDQPRTAELEKAMVPVPLTVVVATVLGAVPVPPPPEVVGEIGEFVQVETQIARHASSPIHASREAPALRAMPIGRYNMGWY
jgi:hypothetical protein